VREQLAQALQSPPGPVGHPKFYEYPVSRIAAQGKFAIKKQALLV
jgi:hypothetical protein